MFADTCPEYTDLLTNHPGMEAIRSEVCRLSSVHSQTDSLLRHYIANSWLAKFATMAEPGPIDNSSVICRHGGVRVLTRRDVTRRDVTRRDVTRRDAA